MTDYLTNDVDLKKVADAIRAKGGTTAPLAFPDGFSAAVGALESGVPAKELNYDGVNFISWDGKVVETWTLEELAAAAELPALPAMPSIDSMSRWRYRSSVQGYVVVNISNEDEATAELQRIACWNSTLADLKSWAAPAIVGICYGDHVRPAVTDGDGNEVTVEGILAQRLAPILIVVDVNKADGMTVTFGDFLGTTSERKAQIYSWGDGTKYTGVTGAAKTHTYTTPGRYVIQIGTLQNIALGNGHIKGTLMSAESAPLVKGIIFPFASEAATATSGNNAPNQFVSFAYNVFEGCSNLKTLAFSPNCIYTGGSGNMEYMLIGCYGLETISIPLTVIVGATSTVMYIDRDLLMLEASPQQDYALKFVVFPTGDKYSYNGGVDVQGAYQLQCLCTGVTIALLSDAAVTVAGVGFSRYFSLRVIDLRKYTAGVLVFNIFNGKLWPMAGGKPLQIKVPAALVDQYKADSSWSAYADYIMGV